MGRGTSGAAAGVGNRRCRKPGGQRPEARRARHGAATIAPSRLLYQRYHRRIHAYVLGMVKDHGRAEDVTQEVFLSALRRMRETEQPLAFKPWLYQIAKNSCIDAFRRSKRAEEVSYDADEGLAPADHSKLVASGASPDAAVAAKQELDSLCGAFGGLSETHHEILVLRELEGLSYQEIGDRMGMSRPAVESTLFRARRRLTEEFDDIVSGARCQRIQGIIVAAVETRLGTRDTRRLARHLSHCQPCRREALAAGLDRELFARPSVRERVATKVAGILPFPIFAKFRNDTDTAAAPPAERPRRLVRCSTCRCSPTTSRAAGARPRRVPRCSSRASARASASSRSRARRAAPVAIAVLAAERVRRGAAEQDRDARDPPPRRGSRATRPARPAALRAPGATVSPGPPRASVAERPVRRPAPAVAPVAAVLSPRRRTDPARRSSRPVRIRNASPRSRDEARDREAAGRHGQGGRRRGHPARHATASSRPPTEVAVHGRPDDGQGAGDDRAGHRGRQPGHAGDDPGRRRHRRRPSPVPARCPRPSTRRPTSSTTSWAARPRSSSASWAASCTRSTRRPDGSSAPFS